jgi:hypothetical protein
MQVLDSKTSSVINDILYFDEVSIKLFSTKTIIVLSDFATIQCSIETNDTFKFFTVDNGVIVNNNYEYTSISAINTNDKFVHAINISANNDTQSNFVSALVLSDELTNFETVMQVTTISEEDRFAVALSNNKFYINEMFVNAFKDSDINEHFTDYKLLNDKRKELLLDLFSIKSFMGVYAGLINALKYFGYDDDVAIKEFWTYFDTRLNDHKLLTKDIEADVSALPKGYAKTNMFNITYKLNDINGEYGPDGLPALIDVFYNEAEAIIKIQNLKILLETYFLPAHAIIVEVVGEHTNFYQSGMGYYVHNAIIHYYSTAIDKLFDTVDKVYHEYAAVELTKLHQYAVLVDKHCVQLSKIYDNNLNIDDVTDYAKFYKDNFATCTLNFNENFYSYIVATSIVVRNSLNAIVFQTTDITDTMIIGFLTADSYTIHVSCTDNYNILHSFTHKITTQYVKHNFKVYTAKHALNYEEPIERKSFKSTKEAFEYFEYYKAAVDYYNKLTTTKYSGLQIIHAYDSITATRASGIQNANEYKTEYPYLHKMLEALQPYR